jgi:hypothetical protein
MRKTLLAAVAAMVLSVGLAATAPTAWADDAKADAAKSGDKDKAGDKKDELPPFPADSTVKQVTHVAV